MKVESKLYSSTNAVVKHIKSVKVTKELRTETIEIHFDCHISPLYIDTEYNVFARSEDTLLDAILNVALGEERKSVQEQGNQSRLLVPLNISGFKNNIKIPFYKLVSIANEIDNGIVRKDYTGLHCNHIDRTGNSNIYGYTNSRMYNLEIVDGTDDEIHWRCIERLQKLTGKHYGVSANDYEIIRSIQLDNNNTLLEKLKTWELNKVVDKYGTIFIGNSTQNFN